MSSIKRTMAVSTGQQRQKTVRGGAVLGGLGEFRLPGSKADFLLVFVPVGVDFGDRCATVVGEKRRYAGLNPVAIFNTSSAAALNWIPFFQPGEQR